MKKKLPFIISVPHAGEAIPSEVRHLCVLSRSQILEETDGGASEIYAFRDEVLHYLIGDIARTIIDLNRAPDDRGTDGVVKTHTIWMAPVYSTPPDGDTVDGMLRKYYHPYHERLTSLALSDAKIGIDCHTMSPIGPTGGPDPGKRRPHVCLSNGDGTCPAEWVQSLFECFTEFFDSNVALNRPFKGGYITRSHSMEMPWVQVELSREPYMTIGEKREAVLAALRLWAERCPGLR